MYAQTHHNRKYAQTHNHTFADRTAVVHWTVTLPPSIVLRDSPARSRGHDVAATPPARALSVIDRARMTLLARAEH